MAGERKEMAKDRGGEQRLDHTMPNKPYYHIFSVFEELKEGYCDWTI